MGNFLKYAFIVFVIGLIGFSVYTIYKNDSNKRKNNIVSDVVDEESNILNDIRIGIAGLDTLNPILSNNKNVQEISKLIFDSILTLDKDYNIQPSLAKEWSQTGELNYVIKLREDVKWHDDIEFTAADVKYTIDILKDPNINSIYKENVANIVGLEIVDTYTIKMILNEKLPFFEYNLTFPILAEHYYINEDFTSTSKNKVPMGTGEYRMSNLESNYNYISLRENDNWWNKDEGKEKLIKVININFYQTMGEVYNAFKTNNIDFLSTNNTHWQDYIGTMGYNYKEFAGREFDYISINNESSLMKNLPVRQAVSLAIDKTNIISNVYNNGYYIANTPIDYNNNIYSRREEGTGYDSELAKQKLIDDGWTYKYGSWQKTGDGQYLRLNLTLVVNSDYEAGCNAADLIKQDLEKIGINVTVRRVNDYQYVNYINNKNYDMMLVAKNRAISPDLTPYIGQGNISNYYNEEVMGILDWTKGVNNNKAIKEKYDRLIQIYNDDIPIIGLYFNKNIVAYNKAISGDISPNSYNLFYNISSWRRQK